jgi:hypothetical protein
MPRPNAFYFEKKLCGKKIMGKKQLGSVCQKIKTFKWLSDVLAHSHGCAASTNGRLEA